MPTAEELKVKVEVPGPPGETTRLAGLNVAVRLGDDVVAVRVTVPLKPPRLARVRAETPLDPETKLTVVGLAEMVKSPTPTVIVVV